MTRLASLVPRELGQRCLKLLSGKCRAEPKVLLVPAQVLKIGHTLGRDENRIP